ncbi:class 1 fructose-bisphosphatase [Notoacmeibacter sp. MSK16QG-6]|uniref:class 1 fructose-bisphosphatase n=1 Tax=Notoacmeibacter sp. MSK16QG-6 TaxID=2957982 RepID=UPI0020A1A598|nr:class 1 fructose-bisphosphatase [Notoacmeibacter sp. MSK16QG-6]MCP1198385.1 class 1 fructose-bisphosphatase [Notoacmeibacter sp. MSK16QG-6]
MTHVLNNVPEGADDRLVSVISQIATVAADIARRIARGGIDEDLAGATGTNFGGDAQKALDVIADEAFMAALSNGHVRHYASEEQDEVVTFNPDAPFAVAIDPLDGSSNIDTNVSIGTIFGIYPAADHPDASFLRPGREMVASGYVIFGPQCVLMVTLGSGVLKYVLDPQTGGYSRIDSPVEIPRDSTEYAINASNYRHWSAPIRAYVDDRVAGSAGPAGQDFNMRWIASLVAETHRILTRGGIFLYPSDARPGYERGRLRYVYECAPIAMLIEQAKGTATNGIETILDQVPDTLHARSPLVFGSANKVARVTTYHELPGEETSALFGTRGLFRS